MPDDLRGPHQRPAMDELGGALRRAVGQVRSEPVAKEEISRCLNKILGSGGAGHGAQNGAIVSVPGTSEVNYRHRNGAPPLPRPECAIPSQANLPGGQNMSTPLNEVVQATCPGCKNSLRIPANWIGQSMKCKHCGLVFTAQAPSEDAPKKKKKKRKRVRDVLANAARVTKLAISKAMPRRRKKKKKKHGDVPQGKPYAPPPAIPVGAPAPGSA